METKQIFHEIMTRYIDPGDRLIVTSNAEKLSIEEKKKLFEEKTPEVIEEVLQYEVSVGKYHIYILSLILECIVQKKDGSFVDMESMKKEVAEIYPHFFDLTPELINSTIKKGYTYVFHSHTENLSEEELAELNGKGHYTVAYDVNLEGVVSDGGFLDLSDSLFNCTYFDENGNVVDLTPLREAMNNRWKRDK